jgi:NRPS condensation-like uncharacterized protein
MEHVRKLSTIEANMAYQHSLLAGNSQATTLVSFEGQPDRHAIDLAFRSLFAHYPLLRATIVDQNDELWFALHDDFSRVAVDVVLTERVDEQALDHALEQELNHILDPRHALWRARVVVDRALCQTHMFFTRHHAICDASAAARLIVHWLEALRQPAAPAALTGGVCMSSDILHEAFGPSPISSAGVAGVAQGATRLAHADHVELSARSSGLLRSTLDKTTTRAVRALCREQGISANALCAALMANSFCRAAELDEIEYFTAISLRERVPGRAPIDDIGCFIAVTTALLRCDSVGIHELARQYQSSLDAALRALQIQRAPHPYIKQRVLALGSDSSFVGIGITNIGNLDHPLEGTRVNVTRMYTAVNRSGGLAGVVLHVSLCRERMTLISVYPEGLMEATLVRAMQDGITRRLLEAPQAGTSSGTRAAIEAPVA